MAPNAFLQNPMVIRADSYDECLERIRRIYGPGFQIMRKRECPPEGNFAFFKKKQYEVTYVVLPSEAKRSFQSTSPATQMDFSEERAKILEANQGTQSLQMKLILDEIKDLHTKLDEKTTTFREGEHSTIHAVGKLLEANDFTPYYINKISERIKKEFSLDEIDDFDTVQKTVVDWIGESIKVVDMPNTARPEVIVLVGPTGIGKTTTIAKLAAYYSGLGNTDVQQGLNIRLITTDNVRIGAKEQLETYGEFMGIPVSFSGSIEDLKKQLNIYGRNVDVVLIDTAGCSPKDYEGLARMRTMLELKGQKTKTFLTISASTKANDLKTILQQYEIFGYDSLIVTKLDETDSIGTVVSVLDEKQKSIAYITDGQKVPRNFKKADPVSFLLNLDGFIIDREHIDEKFNQEKIG